jgi:hypothetical protein
MPKKVWKLTISDKPHKVEVSWSLWTTSGQLIVDGKVIDAWGPSLTGGGARHFKVAGKNAILQSTATSYDLFVDGQKARS